MTCVTPALSRQCPSATTAAGCRALSTNNEDPQGASRPWDKGRDGFVMGEGAGVLMMESLQHAQARRPWCSGGGGHFLGGHFL